MKFDSPKEAVAYIEKLLKSSIEIDYYRLKFILERNNIEIQDILFCDEPSKAELSLVSITLHKEGSVTLLLNSSSWSKYLPAIYQDNDFLKNFLYGLQTTLLTQQEFIDNIEKIFIPETTEFVDWLSAWFGIKYHTVVSNEAKRVMLYNMVELYKTRGTKKYFQKLIKILVGVAIEIEEYRFDKKRKNFFKVIINEKLSDDLAQEKEKLKIITNIINKEKPINTEFSIEYRYLEIDTKEVEVQTIVDYPKRYTDEEILDDFADDDYDY